jgi:succinate dehydrogenase/fumarate reductase flavoprotein subunit
MDYSYLSERVKALQQELAEIAEHNRQYFAKRKHTPQNRAQHHELRERLYKIRAELYALMKKSTPKAA